MKLRHVALMIVTVLVSLNAPMLLLLGLLAYFPNLSDGALGFAYFLAYLAVSLVGGTILGRNSAWRHRIGLLMLLIWAYAIGILAYVWSRHAPWQLPPDFLLAASLSQFRVILWAFGFTVGIQLGFRFMRPFDTETELPNTSLEQTRE